MGYMGFGMRKEAYTRKPKKVFENWKRGGKSPSYGHEFRGHAGNRTEPSSLKTMLKIFFVTLVITLVILVWNYLKADINP